MPVRLTLTHERHLVKLLTRKVTAVAARTGQYPVPVFVLKVIRKDTPQDLISKA